MSFADIRDKASVDEKCVGLVEVITQGFPENRNDVPECIRIFWSMRDNLHIVKGVPIRDKRLLIPKNLRARVLEGLHMAHQGVSSMMVNARQRFFWPGLDAAIRLKRAQCSPCHEKAPSQPSEPMMCTPSPEYPFQQTVMDFCTMSGHEYLVYADRLSGWVEVVRPKGTSFRAIKPILLKWFETFGAPEEIATDGGSTDLNTRRSYIGGT